MNIFTIKYTITKLTFDRIHRFDQQTNSNPYGIRAFFGFSILKSLSKPVNAPQKEATETVNVIPGFRRNIKEIVAIIRVIIVAKSRRNPFGLEYK